MIIKKYNNKFKITYKCNRLPERGSGLEGFEANKHYIGRAFNGLVEVCAEWGRGKPSVLLDYKHFKQYFEILPSEESLTSSSFCS